MSKDMDKDSHRDKHEALYTAGHKAGHKDRHENGPHGPGGRENRDPLGLGDLPMLDPPADGWGEVRAALEADQAQKRRRPLLTGLAAAACLVLVVVLVMLNREASVTPTQGPDLVNSAPANRSVEGAVADADGAGRNSVAELIALSQGLEKRLRTLRDSTAAMPAESAIYLAELEDLIARVDSQLSDTPDSVDLWSQRVNLMLDIESLFQHQFEREYGKMASL